MNSEIFSLLHRLGITPNYAGYFQTAQGRGAVCGRSGTADARHKAGVRRGGETLRRLLEDRGAQHSHRVNNRLGTQSACAGGADGLHLDSRPHTSQFLAALTERVLYGLSSRAACKTSAPSRAAARRPYPSAKSVQNFHC